eukprot:GHVP01014416.1.p1 GENE.GHVP01014416.1~~GHVP01014416.1.p1  ORF type:complete len:444 (+),score=77.81 GHVP01014416.1:115-1446(+)
MNKITKESLIALQKESKEYGFVEYKLKNKLCLSTISISEVAEISNPHVTKSFEKNTEGLICIDGFVCVDSIDDVNDNLTEFDLKTPILQSGNHQMILYQIGLGKSFSSESSTTVTIPFDYDSIYLPNNRIIIRPNRILPKYIIAFNHCEKRESLSRTNNQLCDNCETKEAAILCKTENVSLCGNCDELIHNNKISSKHLRMNIIDSKELSSICQIHSNRSVEYFCPICNLLICVDCKMVGHHSHGEATNHNLISTFDAFTQLSEIFSYDNDHLIERSSFIEDRIGKISLLKNKIEENVSKVKNEIDEEYRRISEELEIERKKRLDILNGDYFDMIREGSEIKEIKGFSKYQFEGKDKVKFIRDWSMYLRLIKEKVGSSIQDDRFGIVNSYIGLNGNLKLDNSPLNNHDNKKEKENSNNDNISQDSIFSNKTIVDLSAVMDGLV